MFDPWLQEPVATSALVQTAAPKVDQLGQVHFPVSCAGEAQAKFHRAMALYHSFAMEEGKVAFDELRASIHAAAWRIGAWR
jgi:hypothetical protein